MPGLSTMPCLGTAAAAPPHPRCAAGMGMLGKAPRVGVPLIVGCSVPCCAQAVPRARGQADGGRFACSVGVGVGGRGLTGMAEGAWDGAGSRLLP